MEKKLNAKVQVASDLLLSKRNMYIIDLIENTTLSPELEHNLWVEHHNNCERMGLFIPEVVS